MRARTHTHTHSVCLKEHLSVSPLCAYRMFQCNRHHGMDISLQTSYGEFLCKHKPLWPFVFDLSSVLLLKENDKKAQNIPDDRILSLQTVGVATSRCPYSSTEHPALVLYGRWLDAFKIRDVITNRLELALCPLFYFLYIIHCRRIHNNFKGQLVV